MTVRDLLASGELGRLASTAIAFRPFPARSACSVGARKRRAAASLLFDLGPHLIDQALALFGAPQTVAATMRTASR